MLDAFELLGVEPRFAVDVAELERRHRELLAQLHPDRKSAAPLDPDARAALLTQLGELNDAYRSLRDPVQRAEQLLRRRGQSAPCTDSPALLARVFEQREAVEAAAGRRDIESLSGYVASARERQSALLRELAAYFEGEPAHVSVPHKNKIGPALEELRYLKKLLETAERALDEVS
jgi:molecular chaperone HscB